MTLQVLRISTLALGVVLCTSAMSDDNKIETANAIYQIRPDPKNEDRKCVFRGNTQLLCIERDLVTFGNPVKTRDYTLIPVYDDCGGSDCGRSQTTLLIEKGRETRIDRTLRRFCVECQGKFDVKPDSNEIAIALDRQEGHQFAALFKDGAITVSKKPLDPNEPLSDDDCSYLYEDYLDSCIGHRGQCRNVSAGLPAANTRSIRFMVTTYAAFPQVKMTAACDAACNAKKKPERAGFDKEICRR